VIRREGAVRTSVTALLPITAVFPETQIQTCIVHLIRNSLSICNWKQRQPVARELKRIYNAETTEAATKLIYLAIRNITKKWKNPPITWKLAATQFAIQFGERFFAADAA
jgi:transposase-like protein